MILEIGTQIGDYRILSRIAKGAYGIVYEAEHTITHRIDALKLMLDSAYTADDEQRFLREIQVQASLQHPNIATVHSACRTPYGLVLAMERVHGESLRTILDRGRLPLREGLRYILDILAALDCAGRLGVVHRDIKPENILTTRDGAVKLTDFGLAHVRNTSARITTSGESLGTPLYMAPEQVDGIGEVDTRSDVYSTGVVLYEIATGRPPFQGTNGLAVMRAHCETQPVLPQEIEPAIGERLNAVILKALEKDPAKRFPSAAEFRTALKQSAGPPRTAVFTPPRLAAAALVGFGICAATLAAGYRAFRHHAAAPVAAKKVAVPPAMPPVPVTDKPPETPPSPLEETAGASSAAVPKASHTESARAARVERKPAPKPNRKPAVRMVPPPTASSRARGMKDIAAVVPAEPKHEEHVPVPGVPAANPPISSPVASAEPVVSAPPVSKPELDLPRPKKRNVVLRVLGRIFGRKAGPPAPALPSDSREKPAGALAPTVR